MTDAIDKAAQLANPLYRLEQVSEPNWYDRNYRAIMLLAMALEIVGLYLILWRSW